MFNVGEHTHSFSHFRAHFSFGESRGNSRTRRTRNTSRSTTTSTSQSRAPHQDGTKQGQRCSHAIWPLDELWTFFRWV